MVGEYFDELPISIQSKKVHLAAIRAFFDVLVQRHVVVLNPALSVRTERYSAVEGRTPKIERRTWNNRGNCWPRFAWNPSPITGTVP